MALSAVGEGVTLLVENRLHPSINTLPPHFLVEAAFHGSL